MEDPTNSAQRQMSRLPCTELVVDRLIWLPVVGSTNTQARNLLLSGEIQPPSDGGRVGMAVVCAEEQKEGHGRLGRPWASNRGASLMASFVSTIDADLTTDHTLNGWLPMIAGLSCLDALNQSLEACKASLIGGKGQEGPCISLKWPNDIFCDGLKMGGILTELVPLPSVETGGSTQYCHGQAMGLVFGIGMNLFVGSERLPTPQSTSLQLHWSPLPSMDRLRDMIVSALARSLRARLQVFCNNPQDQVPSLVKQIGAVSWTLGRQVRANLAQGGTIEGRALALNSDASLSILDDNGVLCNVHTGDVGILS